MDAVRGHSQSTWPVSMQPLHAVKQEEKITGEKSKKQHKQTADEESTATALALAGNSTPALTNKHHRSAVSLREKRFSPPHNNIAHETRNHTKSHTQKRILTNP
ncbi:hypothetical protein TcG_13181 [Trypanosoma cruzi]|nr:hypothetical protein TcG_13181 [Trypanosoma cruzi]